eukprot:7554961-Pyramimonas_sp.AAC.1
MMVSFFTSLELKMSLKALRHSNRKEIIRCASLKYLDAWLGFLGFTRAADELQSCSAQQWEGNRQGR